MSVVIRFALPDDIEALAAVHHAALPPGWEAKAFLPYMQTSRYGCFAAAEADAVAGLAVLQAVADEAEILTIAVAPGRQRHGVGALLMNAGLEWAIAHNARKVYLDVAEGNAAARAFYAHFGFTVFARREHYYQMNRKTPEAALIMRLDIGSAERERIAGRSDKSNDQDRCG